MTNKKIFILLMAASAFLSVSCSTKQDPLAGKDRLREATPPVPVVEKQEPVDSKNLIINAPQMKSFKEGAESSFEITVQSGLKDYDLVEVQIDNIYGFEGAKFDPKTQVFSWTPPLGFTGVQTFRTVTMTIKGIASSSKSNAFVPLSRVRQVLINVEKNPAAPMIDSVEDLQVSYREGATARFTVRAIDKDYKFGAGNAPRLLVLPPKGEVISLAPMISVDRAQFDSATNIWTYSLVMKLDQEVTDSTDMTGFRLQLLSSFGVFSTEYRYDGTVKNLFSTPLSTFPEKFTLKSGVENKIDFTVYDAKSEAVLSLPSNSMTLPDGATIVCIHQEPQAPLLCTFKWTPPVPVDGEAYGTGSFIVEYRNRNPLADPESYKQSFDFSYVVEAAAVESLKPSVAKGL